MHSINNLKPNVNNLNNDPHFFEFDGKTWKLTIKNVAEPLNTIDEEKEMKIYSEFYSRYLNIL